MNFVLIARNLNDCDNLFNELSLPKILNNIFKEEDSKYQFVRKPIKHINKKNYKRYNFKIVLQFFNNNFLFNCAKHN